MPHDLTFTKVTGAGNDFVLIDDRDRSLPLDPSALARLLCSRNFGVGADGILLVRPSAKADFTMEYYNADGSTGGMCGNGGRCIARYAYDHGIAGGEMRFEAFGYIYRAAVTPDGIRLRMKPVTGVRRGIRLSRGEQEFLVDYVNTGAPHAVVFVEDLEGLDVAGIGRWIRNHEAFAPDGANANFVEVVDLDTLRIRTYERGVEAETLACGTGSVASALMHVTSKPVPEQSQDCHGTVPEQSRNRSRHRCVTVQAWSGIRLKVHLHGDGTTDDTAPELEGEAYNVFNGKALISDDASKMLALPTDATKGDT